MKEFFTKVWAWVLKNKVVSIVIASVFTAGIACSIVLPIALKHKHEFGTELKSNETHHWLECECGEQKNLENHAEKTEYAFSATHHWKDCNICGYDMSVEEHNFNLQVTDEAFFKSETASSVTFYKSCKCGAKGSETFSVNKQVGVISSLVISDKVFDAMPVTAPAYQTNSNGAVTIEYKVQGADVNTYTTTAPTNAGDYTVRVSIAGNRVYSAVSETKDFTISKYEIRDLHEDFAYNRQTVHSVDIPSQLVPESGISMQVTFSSANVGAHPTGVKVLLDGVETHNYEAINCTADIVKKELSLSNIVTKEYDGETTGNFEYAFTQSDGLISGDSCSISFSVGSSVVNAGTYNDVTLTLPMLTNDNYKIVQTTCDVEITPKELRSVNVFAKDYDGTQDVKFYYDQAEDGIAQSEGIYVKFEPVDENTYNPVVNVGDYSGLKMGTYTFHLQDGTRTENYEFASVPNNFKLWILDTNPLIIEVSDRYNVGSDYILGSTIKQGSVKVGDSIILPGTPDKVYEVLKIEKFHSTQGQATVGESVGIYIDGMAELTEVVPLSLLYEQGNIPEMQSTFFANIYAYTQAEGGRTTPFVNDYNPHFVSLGVHQEATVTIVDVYGKDDTFVTPGDRALVKVVLTNPVPVSLLENLEFNLRELAAGRTTVTGTISYVGSDNYGNSMVATEDFDTQSGIATVIKLTNTRDEALDSLQFYVRTGADSGNYLTDFEIKLYDSSFNLIEGTFNNTTGEFTKTDTTRWSLAKDATCYIVITTTNASEDVFAWLG